MDAIKPGSQNVREARGRQLASVAKIERVGRRWKVPSQTSASDRYLVDIEDGICTCADFSLRKGTCKHQHAVYYWIAWGRDVDAGAEVVVIEAPKTKRKQYPPSDWSAYHESRKHEKEYVERLLYALCVANVVEPARKPGPGRPPLLNRDQVIAAVMKVYLTKSADRVWNDLERLVTRGLLSKVPHPNSISNFLDDPATTPLLVSLVEESGRGPCVIEKGQYAMDSTGLSTTTYVRWFDFRDGTSRAEHHWVKLHVLVGTVTHAIIAVRVVPESDVTQLEELVRCGRRFHDIREVSADKAYASKENFMFLDDVGITPFIPFQDRHVIDKKCEPWSRALCEFWLNQPTFLEHYHRRSNVETVFSMMKQTLGPSLASKNPDALVNETLCKCIAHNLRCMNRAIFLAGLAPKLWPDLPSSEQEAA